MTRSQNKLRKQKLLAIEADIKEISDAIEVAESCFNETTDSDLMDALIYDRAALESRYNYLIRELKTLEEVTQ
ncbi:MAG: YaaL family protein [Ruminococcus sp.]|nr:YaaL family protein [Ruminococcus sp.]